MKPDAERAIGTALLLGWPFPIVGVAALCATALLDAHQMLAGVIGTVGAMVFIGWGLPLLTNWRGAAELLAQRVQLHTAGLALRRGRFLGEILPAQGQVWTNRLFGGVAVFCGMLMLTVGIDRLIG